MFCSKCKVAFDDVTGRKTDLENLRDLCEPCYAESEAVNFDDCTDEERNPPCITWYKPESNLHPVFSGILNNYMKGVISK